MKLNKNYCIFHIEGEQITFLRKLKESKIEYKAELSNISVNKELGAMDFYIGYDDIISFLNIVYETTEKQEEILGVYVLSNNNWVLIDIPSSIANNLPKRKEERNEVNTQPRIMKVIDCQNKNSSEELFIPYYENWMIHYTIGEETARLFELGKHQYGVSFQIRLQHPEAYLEKSVVKTMKDFFKIPQYTQYKKILKRDLSEEKNK